MKTLFKYSNKVIYIVALFMLISSTAIASSGSLFMFGEPKCPKSLIK
jgi:cyclic lactone autoinducer peptide